MSIKLEVYNEKVEVVGQIEVSERVYGRAVNPALIHQVVVGLEANARPVIAHTKDRSEVRGGGKKPWRQKGTGRARHGSSRSPIWVGGGVVFGPRNERNFKVKINKKMRQAAIFMALSDKVASGRLLVVDKLEIGEAKTKMFAAAMKSLSAKLPSVRERNNILVLADDKEGTILRAGRNLAGVKVVRLGNINLLDILKYKNLVLPASAAKAIDETYQK